MTDTPPDQTRGIADAVTSLTVVLRRDLAAFWAGIVDAQNRILDAWPALSRPARRHRLLKLRGEVNRLTAAADAAALTHLPAAVRGGYELGAQTVALTAGRAAGYSGVDRAAVAALTEDTYKDVLSATRHVREATKTLIRVLAREHVDDKLRDGQTAVQAARHLAADLAQHRIAAVTYADGARHGLADYTEMLIRTKTGEAYQVGGFAQAREQGIQFMEIMDGPSCGLSSHDQPPVAHGLILPIEVAAKYPLSHPRCRRVTLARPDLSSAAAASAAKPLGPPHTAEDIARAAADAARRGRGLEGRGARVRARGTLAPGGAASAAERRYEARVRRGGRPA